MREKVLTIIILQLGPTLIYIFGALFVVLLLQKKKKVIHNYGPFTELSAKAYMNGLFLEFYI